MLTDLPGFTAGAAVPKQDKIRWQRIHGELSGHREEPHRHRVVADPRLGLTELDEILLDVIRPRVEEGLKFVGLLTKSDKLTRSERRLCPSPALQAGGGEAKLFSALKSRGVDDVARLLWQWASTDTPATLLAPPDGPRPQLPDHSHPADHLQYTEGSPGARLKRLKTQYWAGMVSMKSDADSSARCHQIPGLESRSRRMHLP